MWKILGARHPTARSTTHRESNRTTGMLDFAKSQLNPCSRGMLTSKSELGRTAAAFVAVLSEQPVLTLVTRDT